MLGKKTFPKSILRKVYYIIKKNDKITQVFINIERYFK